jgi:hypothetical protein
VDSPAAIGRSDMTRRTPKWAERLFATKCSAADALCHKAEEDERGWDYLVEFPARPLPPPAPADTHPLPKNAYVQVKSNETGRLFFRVKLSNALNAARWPSPWFYVLIVRGSGNRPNKIYAIHVWEELIRESLERVRQAENAGVALNRRRLAIRFKADDERGDHLLSWMEEVIESVGSDYEQQKTKICQTVGYERGYGDALVQFEETNWNQIRRFFLGFGNGISVSRFVYTPARFGIPAREPLVDVNSGVLIVTPSSGQTCQLRLRAPGASAPIALAARLIRPGVPDPPPELQSVRIAADFIDLIYALNGPSTCHVRFNSSEKRNLRSIEHFMTLMDWMSRGRVEADVWIENRRISMGTISIDQARITMGTVSVEQPMGILDWRLTAEISHMLREIAERGQYEIEVSIDDLLDSGQSLEILWKLQAPSFRIEFDPVLDETPNFSSMIYYFYVDLAEHTVYTMFERPVREDILVEGRRRVTAGAAKLVETYVLKASREEERKVMEQDYKRYLESQEKVGTPVGLGDVHVRLDAARNAGTRR